MAVSESKTAEKTEKMSLTDRFITAMFLPKEYGKLLCQSGGKLVQFLLLLILLVGVIRYVIPFLGAIAGMGGMKNIIQNRIPGFSLENGTFTLDEEFEWLDESGGIYVLVDTDVDEFTRDDIPENMVETILVSHTNILFMNQVPGIGGIFQEHKWSEMTGVTVNNDILAENSTMICVILMPFFVLLYVLELIKYLVSGLFYSIVMLLLARTMMIDISFGDIYKSALYAQAIGAVVSAVMYCIGEPILILTGSSFAMLITVMIMNKAFIHMKLQSMP